jgi:hypothetical protein
MYKECFPFEFLVSRVAKPTVVHRKEGKNFGIKQSNAEFKKELNNLLFYYQFCTFQFFSGLYSVYKTLKNYCINFLSLEEIHDIKLNVISARIAILELFTLLSNSSQRNPIIEKYEEILRKDSEKTDLNSVTEINLSIQDNFEFLIKLEVDMNDFFNNKYLCKFFLIFDRLSFLFDKIANYICLRDLQKTIDNGGVYENIKAKITSERIELLRRVQTLQDNKTNLKDPNNNFYSFRYYVYQKYFKFYNKQIEKYNTANYFDKIIYIQDPDQLRLMKESCMEFKNIRIQSDMIKNNFRCSKLNVEIGSYLKSQIRSTKHLIDQFQNIYPKKTGAQSGFNKINSFKSPVSSRLIHTDSDINREFIALLKNEDLTYFRKINFPLLLKKMIKILMLTSHFKDSNANIELTLEYAYLLLKCFKLLCRNYVNLEEVFSSYYNIYIMLIKRSLDTALAYVKARRNSTEKKKASDDLYQKVINESATSFLYLIKSCKFLPFDNLKDHIKIIMKTFFNLYNSQDDKRKVEYHVFYTFLVSRLLMTINTNLVYDYYSFEDLFKSIFEFYEIKRRIKQCINMTYKQIQQICSSDSDEFQDRVLTNINIFFLNFLTVYCLYLNELAFYSQTNSDKKFQKIRFEELALKITAYLDISSQNDKEIESKKNKKINFLKSNSIRSRMSINAHVNIFAFEAMLINSILLFKNESENIETGILLESKHYYLYYESGVIDIILLEKIMGDMFINERIHNYRKF